MDERDLELKRRINASAVKLFNRKGFKFTMDDIATDLSISKKTIYTIFNNKDEMFLSVIDETFSKIKEEEDKIYHDDSLDIVTKIYKILGAMPDGYAEFDIGKIYQLEGKYPQLFAQVAERLETGWEKTIDLLERGMAEGKIKQIPIPIIKAMFEASLEQFFKRDILKKTQISYTDALNAVVDIIMNGIVVSE
ncbi:MAG: TetR/AcrR family transcriptional regulator [Lachnospiraceae bacterium]|nr:TetR/AcrR family transcriptional regulator [Lachnospiraceae bacterium]